MVGSTARIPHRPRRVVIRVLDALFRETLARWINTLPGFTVAGAVATGPALARLCVLRSADVAVVQLRSARPDEIAVIAGLRELRPAPHVVGLHIALEPSALLQLHRAGVHRMVSRRLGVAGLYTALGEVAQSCSSAGRAGALSERELEVLALVSAGCTTDDIAEALAISPHTVSNHTRRIFAKLNVHSRTQAAAEFGRLGLWAPGSGGGSGTGSAPGFGPPATSPIPLTPRERDILGSIALGHSVRQTALALGIAIKTVQSEQRQLFFKLGAHNRSGALARAREQGLLNN